MSTTPEVKMSAAELRCLTESMGLTQRDLSRMLNVNERGVRRWIAGDAPIPSGVAKTVMHWVGMYEQLLHELQEIVDDVNTHGGEYALNTFRTDEEMHAKHPGLSAFPAAFHRHAVGETIQLNLAYESVRATFGDEEVGA